MTKTQKAIAVAQHVIDAEADGLTDPQREVFYRSLTQHLEAAQVARIRQRKASDPL